MDRLRYLECLAADRDRLREMAARDLSPPVPSCPGWTVADLVHHVAAVYLHKVECIRTGAPPKRWPPDFSGEAPLAVLDRAYASLLAELTERDPSAPAGGWYEPDRTVGFWVRRMAHETVIHRVDAELAAGEPVASIPADLAADGVAEVLDCFLAYGSQHYGDEIGPILADSDGRAVMVAVGGARWLVRLEPDGVRVEPDTAGQAGAQVSGDPQAVLLWLWGRAGDDAIRADGDPALVTHLRQLLVATTQ
jgi:uncharacterized protein (TIGR03083 family)